jgi:CheY-like chemotaxis protein
VGLGENPASRCSCRTPVFNHPESARSPPTELRLLVVDDDPLSTRFLAHLCALLGHNCTAERVPSRALELAASGQFDVLLLDLEMPTMNGYELLERLRADERAADRAPLPVIAVTGYNAESDRLRCLMAGFNEHLGKPIHVGALGAALQAVAERRGVGLQRSDEPSDAERLRDTVQRLMSMRPGARDFAPSVIETFALRSAQLIETLQGARPADDPEASRTAAQALAASAEFLGATRLARMSRELAALGEAGTPEWQRRLHAIENEHQAVLTVLFDRPR